MRNKIIYILLTLFLLAGNVASQNAGRVSVDFQNADISLVLKTFSDISGKNIVATKNVKAKVTVTLKNLPWQQAFQTILDMYGLTYIEDNGIIKVMTVEESKRFRETRQPQTHIFQIKYAKADELQGVVSPLLSSSGKIVVDKRTNSLVITDVPSAIREIDSLIQQLDTPTPQVLIQARVVEINHSVAKALGIDWSAIHPDNPATGLPFNVKVPLGTAATGSIRFGKFIAGMGIDATIDMLESESKANVLSQPSIIVADNQQAEILSGKQIPIITRDMAGNQVIQFYNVALRLTVTPHISPDSTITLELNPEVSDIAGEAPGGAGVMISTQQAKTQLTVKNGETVVIGGIMRSHKKEGESRVPFFSRIPLIGMLFKSRREDSEKSELMIFVTPRIISYAGVSSSE